MLKEKISKVDKQMRVALAEIRETFKHSGNKGTSTENIFSKFVRQYLPRRLEIGNGEIIDSFGNRSGQADIVIVNEDHPFTFIPDKPGLFFIEGVSAVGEIKTILTSQELINTLKNSVLYKKLKKANSTGSMVLSNQSDLKRYHEHPPFFLFAYESQVSLTSIFSSIEKFVTNNSHNNLAIIDAVFILDKGWLINFGDGKGALQFRRTTDGQSLEGWIFQESDAVLFNLFRYISITMPKEKRLQPILTHYFFSDI